MIMNRYTILVVLLTITIHNISAQTDILFKESIQDSIKTSDFESLNSLNTSVKLKNLRVINCQMDSILRNTPKRECDKYISSYYLTLAKHEENLYIEIMNIDSHNNIVNFYRKGVSTDNYLRKGSAILGCIIYNDTYFYVISLPKPNSVEAEDTNGLFDFTDKEIIIKKEKTDDSLFFIESPIKLYHYVDGRITLLNPRHP